MRRWLPFLSVLALAAPLAAQRGGQPGLITGYPTVLYGKTLSPTSLPYNIMDYGGKCDGATDDAVAYAKVIAAAAAQAAGGTIYIPGWCRTKSTITITSSNIHLVGARGSGLYPANALNTTSRIMGDQVNGPVVDVVGVVDGFAMMDLSVTGGGVALANSQGVRMATQGSHSPYFFRMFFDQFAGPAIQLGTAAGNFLIGAVLVDVVAQNSLLGRPNVDTGVFDLNASDLMADRCYATASVTAAAGQIGNGHSFGWAWRGTNGAAVEDMAELSQKGWLISGSYNRFTSPRAFLNQGDGFVVTGAGNAITGGIALSNSRTADNTSPGFTVTGQGNTLTGNLTDSQVGSDPIQQSFGITETNGPDNAWGGNHYANNRIGPNNGVRTALYSGGAGTGTAVENPIRTAGSDRGDVSPTVQCDVDVRVQWFSTPLTAPRTLTISTTGVYPGCQFMVVRTALATGASALTVQNAGATQTKALAVGQWVLFEYNGALFTFREVAFGSL